MNLSKGKKLDSEQVLNMIDPVHALIGKVCT